MTERQSLPPIDDFRLRSVAAGIYSLMRISDESLPPANEMSEEDRDDLRSFSTAVIRIWDGLNARPA